MYDPVLSLDFLPFLDSASDIAFACDSDQCLFLYFHLCLFSLSQFTHWFELLPVFWKLNLPDVFVPLPELLVNHILSAIVFSLGLIFDICSIFRLYTPVSKPKGMLNNQVNNISLKYNNKCYAMK